MFRFQLSSIVLTLAVASSVAARDARPDGDAAVPELEPLTITGTRLAQPATEVGSTVYVITREELERTGVDFVTDALARIPGVTVNQNGAFGGQAAVRIRGAASAQTLVLIDGVPVNDPSAPSGGFDFARLDPAYVERIEVLMGPQSTLWGTDAMGGVVSIRTRAPAAGLGGDAFAAYGSFDTLRAGASLSGGGDRGDFRVGVTRFDSDGISAADEDAGNREADGYDSTQLSMAGGVRFGADARLDGSLLRTEADTAFDSFVFGAPGNVGDGDEVSETEETTARLRLGFASLDGRLQHLLMVGHSDIERQNFTDGAAAFGARGTRRVYRYQGDLDLTDGHRLTFGVERDDSEADGQEVAIDGLFALYELAPLDTVTLTAGLRRDDHERYGGETTGRLAAAWNPSERLTVRGSWGQGFKAPTLFQTTFFCCGADGPDPELVPETSDGFDVGIDYRTVDGRGALSVTWFELETENLIDFSFTAGAFENIAFAASSGLELSGRYALTPWLALTADYAYIDAEDGSGAPLARVPKNTADLALDFSPKGPLTASLLARFNDSELDANGETDAWTRIDLSARYALGRNSELFGRIENLLDEEYQQVLGYGTPDRSGYLGVRYRF